MKSTPSIKKRFDSIQLASTEESRRDYREMLFTTPGMGDYISGVILFDETLRQKTKAGVPFTEGAGQTGHRARHQGSISAPSPCRIFRARNSPRASTGLRERLAEYVKLGARFTKWRAVIKIGDGLPTRACLDGKRPRTGALRRAEPGSRARSNCRA